jgi:hypothetical protein
LSQLTKNYCTFWFLAKKLLLSSQKDGLGSGIRNREKPTQDPYPLTLAPLLLFFLSENWGVEKMAKRNATTELTHDNWDQEEESEEAGTFKQV